MGGHRVEVCWFGGLGKGLAIDALEGVMEFLVEFYGGGGGQGFGGEAGGDLEGTGDLAEGHFFDFLVAKALEEALGGSEEFLGGSPFLLAELVGTAGPIGGLFAAGVGLGLDLLLQEAGLESGKAIVPAVSAGPIPNGVRLLTEEVGHGVMGADVAELKVGHEGGEGARGLAGEEGESGGRGRINGLMD
jgi:hypothetical protein